MLELATAKHGGMRGTNDYLVASDPIAREEGWNTYGACSANASSEEGKLCFSSDSRRSLSVFMLRLTILLITD